MGRTRLTWSNEVQPVCDKSCDHVPPVCLHLIDCSYSTSGCLHYVVVDVLEGSVCVVCLCICVDFSQRAALI